MFRLILLFAAVVLVIAAVPSIIESLRHLLGRDALGGEPLGQTKPGRGRSRPGRGGPAEPSPSKHAGTTTYPDTDLKRDPVCGTLIYAGSAYQKAGRGETLYFCSIHCRDEYKG